MPLAVALTSPADAMGTAAEAVTAPAAAAALAAPGCGEEQVWGCVLSLPVSGLLAGALPQLGLAHGVASVALPWLGLAHSVAGVALPPPLTGE